MHRRNLFRAALASVGAAFATATVTKAQAATPDKSKVVYHLNETDRVQFVIGNIENHFEGMGGPDKVTIALVVHGPALRAFHAASAPLRFSTYQRTVFARPESKSSRARQPSSRAILPASMA